MGALHFRLCTLEDVDCMALHVQLAAIMHTTAGGGTAAAVARACPAVLMLGCTTWQSGRDTHCVGWHC